MFGIGGLNPAALLASTMLGPMGGIVAQLATQIISQVGQQLIQNLGNNMGLPQSTIDFAQSSFASRYGDFPGAFQNVDEGIAALGQEMGASPFEVGAFQRDISQQMQDLNDQLMQQAFEGTRQAERRSRGGGSGEGGWLQAIAEALGGTLNEMASEMSSMAEQITKDTPDLTTKFSALSQQFSILFNAASTSIKSIGEGMSSTARKQ